VHRGAQGRTPAQKHCDSEVSYNSRRGPQWDYDSQVDSRRAPQHNYESEVSYDYRRGSSAQYAESGSVGPAPEERKARKAEYGEELRRQMEAEKQKKEEMKRYWKGEDMVGPSPSPAQNRAMQTRQEYVSEMPRHTAQAEPEYSARSGPSYARNSDEPPSFEGVSLNRLQQMFSESKQRMANMKQDDVDDAYLQSSAMVPDSYRDAPDFRKPHNRASFPRANSGSTTASSSRYSQAFDDGASDAGSDGIPLGADWSSFNQY